MFCQSNTLEGLFLDTQCIMYTVCTLLFVVIYFEGHCKKILKNNDSWPELLPGRLCTMQSPFHLALVRGIPSLAPLTRTPQNDAYTQRECKHALPA